MKKKERHLLIKKLINDFPISTQEELLTLLEQEGVKATQATISRDIRELKIVKVVDDQGVVRFDHFKDDTNLSDTQVDQRLISMIEDIVIKVERVHFLTIVTTIPDNAPLFAAVLDDIKPAHMISTIAGFDTVVVISNAEEEAKKIEEYFNQNIRLK